MKKKSLSQLKNKEIKDFLYERGFPVGKIILRHQQGSLQFLFLGFCNLEKFLKAADADPICFNLIHSIKVGVYKQNLNILIVKAKSNLKPNERELLKELKYKLDEFLEDSIISVIELLSKEGY